jgi:nucleoside-diphosphate-sugar epimerase
LNILVIGSEGFIGGFLTKALLAAGHRVVGYDIGKADEERSGYPLRSADLMDAALLADACRGVDMVINLAAKHHDFGISRADFFNINETGTENILKAVSAAGIRKFMFYSSVAVYGDVEDCSSERSPLNPSNDYGESKLAGERVVERWVKEDPARSAVVVRPAVVYGPHNYANMRRLIENIHRRRFLMVGPGDNIKSAAYVENLVAATMLLLSRQKPGLEICNYSDYPHYTYRQLVDMVTDSLGRRRFRFHLPLGPVAFAAGGIDWLGETLGVNFPITAKRIRKLNSRTWHGSDKIRALGYEQSVPTEEGIRRMVRWYLSQSSSSSGA